MATCDWNRINLDLFVDRDLLAERINGGLRCYESFCLLGGRKMGKTTLLKKISVDCEPNLKPVYLNFQTAPPGYDLRWIAEEIARAAGEPFAWNGDFVRSMEPLIHAIKNRGHLLVILLDEVESVESLGWAGTFFDNLNHLLFTNESTSRGVGLVLAGGTFLDGSPKLSPCSPLLMRLTILPLKLFDIEGACGLCTRIGVPKDELLGVAKQVHQATAGHPALMQYYLGKMEDCEWKLDLVGIGKQLKNDALKLCESVFRCVTKSDLKIYSELGMGGVATPSTPSKLREMRASLSRMSYLGVIGLIGEELGRRGPQVFRNWYEELAGAATPRDPLAALKMDKDENQFLEYKSTHAVDLYRYLSTGGVFKNSDVAQEVPQAVVGLLNAEGGDIIIGICEPKGGKAPAALEKYPNIGSKKVIGLELDYSLLKGGWDEFMGAILSHMKDKVDATIGASLAFQNHLICEKQVAVLTVPRGTRYYYYDSRFFVRVQNRTQMLTTEEAVDYMRENPR